MIGNACLISVICLIGDACLIYVIYACLIVECLIGDARLIGVICLIGDVSDRCCLFDMCYMSAR